MPHCCHGLHCGAPCPPKHLLCPACWAHVPGVLQREVHRTVKLRGTTRDHTWAPWWRAQAQARYESYRVRMRAKLVAARSSGVSDADQLIVEAALTRAQAWLNQQLDIAKDMERLNA